MFLSAGHLVYFFFHPKLVGGFEERHGCTYLNPWRGILLWLGNPIWGSIYARSLRQTLLKSNQEFLYFRSRGSNIRNTGGNRQVLNHSLESFIPDSHVYTRVLTSLDVFCCWHFDWFCHFFLLSSSSLVNTDWQPITLVEPKTRLINKFLISCFQMIDPKALKTYI